MPCDVYVVVHFARTCEDRGVYLTKDSSEIIEIGWIVIDSKTLTELVRGSALVRPVNTPITAVCSQTTGLNWDHLQGAGSLAAGLGALDQCIQEHVLLKGLRFAFVVLSAFELKVDLVREARDKALILPRYLAQPRLFDIRGEYSRWQLSHPESHVYANSSISSMCAALDVVEPSNISSFYPPRVPGNGPRRALEEAELLAQITKALLNKSSPGLVFQRPIDVATDSEAFLKEKGKVLYMTNLPQDVTQSELESWFTQYGGRPIAFWTLKTPDQYKSTQTGFAVFGTHQEASDCLVMNGRALNDRAIEVAPSSGIVLERAQEILSSFPTSKNRPRPGDWNCASCGFSNFQRRTACFRCNYPQAPNAGGHAAAHFQYQQPGVVDTSYMNNLGANNGAKGAGAANTIISTGSPMAVGYSNNNYNHHMKNGGSGGVTVPFRAGDWKCGNEGCNYHNFAKNINCLKCGANRVAAAVFGGDPYYHGRYAHHHHHQQQQQQQQQPSAYRRADLTTMNPGYGQVPAIANAVPNYSQNTHHMLNPHAKAANLHVS